METAHEIILAAGVLCLLATCPGLVSARIGTPLLLAFIGIGMLAGEDGPGGIQFDDFRTAYLVGSLALAAILFQGGISTERGMVKQALWPAVALATAGVAISAGVVGAAVVLLFGVSWPEALLLGEEMGGGTVIGLASGYALLRLFRWLDVERSVFPVFAVGGALATFGAAQVLGASGFLTVYLAGAVVGNAEHPAPQPITRFFGALGWLAQIALFLMLGLLVTPHELPPVIVPALAVSAVLILVARPAGVMACLLPFRWTVRETAFVAWAGLRGAVPIFLTTIPLLAGVRAGRALFDIVFVAVIVSVAVQGWTAASAARLLELKGDPPDQPALPRPSPSPSADVTAARR